MRSFLALLSFLLVFPMVFGCSSMRANSARQNYIHRATEAYVHKRSIETVFPEARKILFEYGYQVRDSDGNTLETEWATDGQTERRYLVTATKVNAGYRVNFTRSEQRDSRSVTTDRDLDFEWLLLQRLDPKYAAEVSKEADLRAQAAAN